MQIIITIVCTVLASSGFWLLIERYLDLKDVRTKLLIGIGHDRIITLGMMYIERGWITKDEFENLYDYLYIPYQKAGGKTGKTAICIGTFHATGRQKEKQRKYGTRESDADFKKCFL